MITPDSLLSLAVSRPLSAALVDFRSKKPVEWFFRKSLRGNTLVLLYPLGACPRCDVARYRPAAIATAQMIAASLSPSTTKRHFRVLLPLKVGGLALPLLRGTPLPRVWFMRSACLYHHTSETHVRARDFRACVRVIRTYQESKGAQSKQYGLFITFVNCLYSESAVLRRNV